MTQKKRRDARSSRRRRKKPFQSKPANRFLLRRVVDTYPIQRMWPRQRPLKDTANIGLLSRQFVAAVRGVRKRFQIWQALMLEWNSTAPEQPLFETVEIFVESTTDRVQ